MPPARTETSLLGRARHAASSTALPCAVPSSPHHCSWPQLLPGTLWHSSIHFSMAPRQRGRLPKEKLWHWQTMQCWPAICTGSSGDQRFGMLRAQTWVPLPRSCTFGDGRARSPAPAPQTAPMPAAEHQDQGCPCNSIIPGAARETAPFFSGGSLCPDFPIQDGKHQSYLPPQREPRSLLVERDPQPAKSQGVPRGQQPQEPTAPRPRRCPGRAASSAGHKPPASSPGSPHHGARVVGSLLVLSSH